MGHTHPRGLIREAIRDRLATHIRTVDDQTYPSDYDYTLTEGDEGYLAPILRKEYWTKAEDRVYKSRSIEITPDELPLILISAKEETAEPTHKSDWDGSFRRQLTLNVEGIFEALDDVEDDLDDMAYGIEGALDGLNIAHAESSRLLMTATELDVDREGEIPLGAIRITYECTYITDKLGVDFGMWDRDYPDSCPTPTINKIILRSHIPEDSVEFTTMEVDL